MAEEVTKMKTTWKNGNGNVVIEFECDNVAEIAQKIVAFQRLEPVMLGNGKDTELFQALAELDNTDVLKAENCGKCGSSNLAFVVRTDDDENKYYEWRCLNKGCFAKLPFGCHKKGGGLFAKRRDDSGYRGSNGWVKFNKEKGVEE
jgi:hypothetical protein